MTRTRIIVILVSALSMSLLACREIYEPTIDIKSNALVVQGLITDQPGPHYIKLTTTIPFNSGQTSVPVVGAQVSVDDDQGATYIFNEFYPGEYRSSEDMIGMNGRIYTLNIHTQDGYSYKSSPQTLLPSIDISSIKSEIAIKNEVSEDEFGNLVLNEIQGISAILQTEEDYENNPMIRFKSEIIVQYVYPSGEAPPEGPGPLWYCWKIYEQAEGINNINLPTIDNIPGNISNTIVAFVPRKSNKYYSLPWDRLIQGLLLNISVYTINQTSYQYYYDVIKQINSDESLFSPIPSQINSNMKCVNDPNKIVVGHFEASSKISFGFIVRERFYPEDVHFELTNKLDSIPPSNCIDNVKPDFWVNN
jgi:hypothetical protein